MVNSIPESEKNAVWQLFFYSLILACSYTLARTVGDSLFLSRIGSDDLAGVYVASGITTAIVATVWYALTYRMPLAASLRISGIVFALFSFLAWWALPTYHHSIWLLAGIYLLADVKGCVNAINIVTAMNDILGGHANRQSWARIGLGMPLAGVLIGSLVGIEANFVSLRSWLLLSAMLDLAGVLPVWRAGRLRVPKQVIDEQPRSSVVRLTEGLKRKTLAYARSRKFQFWIGCLIATKVVVLTMVAFEWKTSVNAVYGDDEKSMTRYFGVFYAATGVVTLLLQAFVADRLMQERKIAFPILVMPLALLFLNALFFFGTGVVFLAIVTTFAKATEVWRRSVHDTILGFLYTKIERKKRRQTIAFNSGLIKPLAEVSASFLLLFGSQPVHKIVLLLMTGLWLVSTVSLIRLIFRTREETEVPAENVPVGEHVAGNPFHLQ